MRLDRYLAECGCGTRSEVKNLIKKGRVSVNEAVITDNSVKVETDTDAVKIDGTAVGYEQFRYYMLNKPAGCISATNDGLSSTVLDILADDNTRDLFPVGRLDKDTEGLLLITNDGQLAHRLLSPKKHVDKTYVAAVSVALGEEELERFAQGLDIGDDKPTLPAEIRKVTDHEDLIPERFGADDGDEPEGYEAVYEVIIREGRYHQIKRMFEALGSRVVYLKRTAMGALSLDGGLEPGEYRRLTEDEIAAINGQH